MSAETENKQRKRNRLVLPEPIPDTPENVAKAVLFTPPKKRDEWKYMQNKKGKTEPK